MKVYLVDNANDGHHEIYQKTLNNIQNTEILNKICKLHDVKSNPIKAYKERRDFIKEINIKTTDNIVHFLYIDSLYKCPFISGKLKKNKKYIGTLHWIPNDLFRVFLLKRFSKKMEYIVVHSEFLKKQLEDKGIKNVKCIDYPSFIKCNDLNNNKQKDKVIISCLGGTRLDKGLDILLESFKYINNNCKDKLQFNICGIEQDIKYNDIILAAEKNNVIITYKNKFLTDAEYENEIIKSDVILLPYKKIFSGNSGPMTDGIYANKYILGPNEGNLGYLINKYNLGMTFEQENPIDLANKISLLVNENLHRNSEYRERLNIETFLKLYKNIYNKLLNKDVYN